jgi:cold shock CspA family protein
MTEARCLGTVTSYAAEKGYGRIQDEHDREFFVHYRDTIDRKSLNVGQKVNFLACLQRKGNIAREVRPA